MKKVILLTFALALVGVFTLGAQTTKWQCIGSLSARFAPHGVAVDGDGNIWYGSYGASGDSLGTVALYAPIVYNRSDLSVKARIKTLNWGSTFDTMKYANRGVITDHNGNILYSAASRLYRIDRKTLNCTGRYLYSLTSVTQVGEVSTGDAKGYIYVGPVVNPNPVIILDSNFTVIGPAIDTTKQIARHLWTTADGMDIYFGSTTGPGVVRYHSDAPGLILHTPVDTMLQGLGVETMTWHKQSQKLWVSATNNGAGFTAHTWYAFDLTTKQLTDSIAWDTLVVNKKAPKPRGMAFSLNGDTAFIAGFDGGAVLIYKKVTIGVERGDRQVAEGYALEQNYPNPFNPTTEIRFSINKTANTTLKVYDLLGREVATLQDGVLNAGQHSVTFNGRNLASGTYMYVLTSGETRLVKKMMLLK